MGWRDQVCRTSFCDWIINRNFQLVCGRLGLIGVWWVSRGRPLTWLRCFSLLCDLFRQFCSKGFRFGQSSTHLRIIRLASFLRSRFHGGRPLGFRRRQQKRDRLGCGFRWTVTGLSNGFSFVCFFFTGSGSGSGDSPRVVRRARGPSMTANWWRRRSAALARPSQSADASRRHRVCVGGGGGSRPALLFTWRRRWRAVGGGLTLRPAPSPRRRRRQRRRRRRRAVTSARLARHAAFRQWQVPLLRWTGRFIDRPRPPWLFDAPDRITLGPLGAYRNAI